MIDHCHNPIEGCACRGGPKAGLGQFFGPKRQGYGMRFSFEKAYFASERINSSAPTISVRNCSHGKKIFSCDSPVRYPRGMPRRGRRKISVFTDTYLYRRRPSSLPDQFLAYRRFCTVSSCKSAHNILNPVYAAVVFPLSIAASVPSSLTRTRPPWTLATSYFGTRWFFIQQLAGIVQPWGALAPLRRQGSRTSPPAARYAPHRATSPVSDRGCGRFRSAPHGSPPPGGRASG